MHRTSLAAAALLVCAGAAHAAEGMWTLDNLPKDKMRDAYGFAPGQAWVDKVMHASVRLAGGCSGSFISPDGLVMTNHHCAIGCVQQVSTPENDLVAKGFLARKRDEELRCPEIELNRLDTITDVTEPVQRATAGLDGAAFAKAQDAIRAKLAQDCRGNDKETVRCDVVTLYQGGQYQLYKYHRFSDVRLVWAPEAGIASFGGDPDNFNFPRWNLDISLLRAYEGGKPVAPKDYFRFSKAGAQPGELTMVVGHPGNTDRLLTVAQLESRRRELAESDIPYVAERRGMLLQYAKQGPEPARLATTQINSFENTLKVLRGQLQALDGPVVMARKREEERALQAFVASQPASKDEVAGAWDAIARAQVVKEQIDDEASLIEFGRGFSARYFGYARTLVRGAAERGKPDGDRLPEYADAVLPQREQRLRSTAPVYPAFEQATLAASLTTLRSELGQDHPVVAQVLGKDTPDAVAARLVGSTKLGDPAERMKLWEGGQAAIDASTDPFIQLVKAIDPAARALRTRYDSEVKAVETKNAERIAKARFAQTGKSVYPDATFSLRLSYGEVKGWDEKGKPVDPYTDFAGVFKRATGSEPFALPPRWLAVQGKVDGAQRFNFVSTNDIIGGNSGSPVINRNAEIVGLAFDGNIHSLGGAFAYDETVNRTVSVHSGAILEALRKVYDADFLAKEITGAK